MTSERRGRSCRLLPCFLVACAVVALGCGKSGTRQRAAVYGRVTVAGQPVASGSITFLPTSENAGPAVGGLIEDGTYSIKAAEGPVVGPNRVEIRGMKKTGRKVPSRMIATTMVDELVPAVPPQYHADSPLKCDVESGENELNFDLDAP